MRYLLAVHTKVFLAQKAVDCRKRKMQALRVEYYNRWGVVGGLMCYTYIRLICRALVKLGCSWDVRLQ